MVIDVFSRMVVGMYVGFEGPSWVSAMVALTNTIADKVEYCRQYDVDISAGDWAVKGLPDVFLLADKGERKRHQSRRRFQKHSVSASRCAARRGDAKGIVERYFLTVQENFKPYASGVVEDTTSRKRGGHDYRLDATLTLREFTRIIIAGVLWHNNFHTLSKYDRAAGMPGDLPAIPAMLWRWGLANLTGRLRIAPEVFWSGLTSDLMIKPRFRSWVSGYSAAFTPVRRQSRRAGSIEAKGAGRKRSR